MVKQAKSHVVGRRSFVKEVAVGGAALLASGITRDARAQNIPAKRHYPGHQIDDWFRNLQIIDAHAHPDLLQGGLDRTSTVAAIK